MTGTNDEALRVLCVDPAAALDPSLTRDLSAQGVVLRRVDRLTDDDDATTADVVLFLLADDASDVAGLPALQRLLTARTELPVVVTGQTEHPDLDIAVIERGAEDFVNQPVSTTRLVNALRLAVVRFRKRTPAAAATPAARPRASGAGLHPLWKLEPGTRLDRYEVERIIGRGGMAVVYRVRHVRLGSVHALKVVLPTPGAQTQRLLAEGQAQARLRHPNLVRATDILELDPGIGLVMEYVEGPTLHDWMDSTHADACIWLSIFKGIVRGIRHAHGLGLVHRDLKPANVLLLETVDAYIPKVADFGIAKILPRPGAHPLPGEPGIGIGTVGFVAPEQYASPDSVDQRADLFSLGCVLYPLATGVPAFPGQDPLAVIRAMQQGRYVSPAARNPALSGAFTAIVDGLLHVDPNRRTPSCQALLEQLDQLDPTRLPARQPRTPDDAPRSTLDPFALDALDLPWTTGWRPQSPGPDSPTR